MNRRTMLVAACILAVAATALLTSGASASPKGKAATTQLRTLAAAKSYLASRGIDARSVVIQRSARNYAGPNCPGKGWNCTTAKRVLQVGKDNQVDCTPGTGSVVGDTQTCTIMQGSPTSTTGSNRARCTERSSSDAAVQDCSITQYGADNQATVDQAVEANGGPGQSAVQTIEVMQTAATGNNALRVKQHVHQHTHAAGGQTQDVHQELLSTQSASGAGNNTSDVKQDQNQDAHNGLTQSQNTGPAPSGMGCSSFPVFDPNQCADITQTADAGNNNSDLDQSVDEDMESNAATTQDQGAFNGGVSGRAELMSVTGASTNNAQQKKSQKAKGKSGTVSQRQIDPMGCCSFSSQGNTRSTEHIDQSSTQNASGDSTPFQELTILGSANSTLGSCTIKQHASNNGASSNTSVPPTSPCVFVTLGTQCTSASPGGVETPPTPAMCQPFTPSTDAPTRG